MQRNKILVVDDDPDIRNVVNILLQSNGFLTVTVENVFKAVLELRKNDDFDLVIMDIMMPEVDGIDGCKKIREFSNVPMLFLSAKSNEATKFDAYSSGGDDFISKPFSQNELLFKINSLIRRYRVYSDNPVLEQSFGLCYDKQSHSVFKNGEKVDLTDKEKEILGFFFSRRGQSVDSKSIYESVWGEKYLPSSANTVMVHILNLRKKLEDNPADPKIIRTVWGKGYQVD